MSSSEVERFVGDLKTDDGLRSALAENASSVGSVVSFANEKGYDITVEEAGAYIQAQATKELSDVQLDAISGGKTANTVVGLMSGGPVSSVVLATVVVNNNLIF